MTDCPNCKKMRADLLAVREAIVESASDTIFMANSIETAVDYIDFALAPTPEERGETPLLDVSHV